MITRENHPVHPDYSILTETYLPTIKGLIQFELISFVGKTFFKNKPKRVGQGEQLLHLGCGTTFFDDWVNADFYRVKFWKKPKPDWLLDLRYPLNCPDNYFAGVFTEHTFEHLSPAGILRLLKELYRVMKPGAYIRICVPGLDQTLKPYLTNDQSEESKEIRKLYPNLATAIWGLTQTWVHFSVWNEEQFVDFLTEAGFKNAKEVQFNEGSDQKIIMDSENRRIGSLYMEAIKG